jgi:hypothetical protein
MPRYLLKAWLIGLTISLVGFALSAIVHTPLALVGVLISAPGMLGMALLIGIGQRMALGETTVFIVSLVSVPIFGSIFYGALVFVVLRLRERHALKSKENPSDPNLP